MLSLKLKEEQREEGFTLIELLVVVIIIGILAAIAIPVFLNQRERAWAGSVESDLRNAAIQMETYFTRHGEHAVQADFAEVFDDTQLPSSGVEFVIEESDDSHFCLVGGHANLTDAGADNNFTIDGDATVIQFAYDSSEGGVQGEDSDCGDYWTPEGRQVRSGAACGPPHSRGVRLPRVSTKGFP
jgi:type IV pilus assembly protein PilA